MTKKHRDELETGIQNEEKELKIMMASKSNFPNSKVKVEDILETEMKANIAKSQKKKQEFESEIEKLDAKSKEMESEMRQQYETLNMENDHISELKEKYQLVSPNISTNIMI